MTPETKAIHGTDSVSICVCTFRRVHLLDVLLRALMLQRLDDTSPLPEISACGKGVEQVVLAVP